MKIQQWSALFVPHYSIVENFIMVFPWPYITVSICIDNPDSTHSDDSISSSWNQFGLINLVVQWRLKIETKPAKGGRPTALKLFWFVQIDIWLWIVVKIMCHDRNSEFPWLRNIFESTADRHIALMFFIFCLMVIYIYCLH